MAVVVGSFVCCGTPNINSLLFSDAFNSSVDNCVKNSSADGAASNIIVSPSDDCDDNVFI